VKEGKKMKGKKDNEGRMCGRGWKKVKEGNFGDRG
jgi:hypothetical protein